MKKLIRSIAVIAILVAVQSCYKDLSTEATISIPDIEIVAEGVPDTLNILFGDVIRIKPEVTKEGVTDTSAFTYDWRIDLNAGSEKNRIELSDERCLEYLAKNTPSSEPYILTLEVIEKATGLGSLKYWPVYISNSIGEGLLVAYTRDNGLTSELDFVSGQPVTYGYKSKKEHYVRELLKMARGEDNPFCERINAMISQACSNNAVCNEVYMCIGTDEHFYRFDPLTFEIKQTDNETFTLGSEDSYRTTHFCHAAMYNTYAFINGGVYSCVDHAACQFTKMVTPLKIFSKASVSAGYMSQGRFSVLDNVNGKILSSNAAMLQGAVPSQALWNPIQVDLKGATPIAAGNSRELFSGFVFEKDGRYYIATFDPLTTETGGCYELNAPEIGDAVGYSFCDGADLFFYATPENIYSTVISGSTATTRKVAWSPDSKDEKITDISQYLQAWYGTHNWFDYEFTLPTHKMQMLVTTYNEKTGEGKIYLRPYNVSTGMFTMKSNGCYTFPGEILCTATTFK